MRPARKSRAWPVDWQEILPPHTSRLPRWKRSALSANATVATWKIPSTTKSCVSSPDYFGAVKVTNVLFVCSANRLRSPTAEQVFSTWPGIETDSAGISNDADVLLSTEQVEWADIIFVMEKAHRTKLNRKFRASLNGKRVICLDIPDDYEFMDPVLVGMLENRAGRFLSRPAPTRSTRVKG